MKKEIIYKHDWYNVYAGKKVIAKTYLSLDGKITLKILQGMPRDETIKKICADCPQFVKSIGIDENYYPYLFSR